MFYQKRISIEILKATNMN